MHNRRFSMIVPRLDSDPPCAEGSFSMFRTLAPCHHHTFGSFILLKANNEVASAVVNIVVDPRLRDVRTAKNNRSRLEEPLPPQDSLALTNCILNQAAASTLRLNDTRRLLIHDRRATSSRTCRTQFGGSRRVLFLGSCPLGRDRRYHRRRRQRH